jgi:hypothetical protein
MSIKSCLYETKSLINNKWYILKHNSSRIYMENDKFRHCIELENNNNNKLLVSLF